MSGSRLRRPPAGLALGLAVLVGAAGSAGVLYSARERSEDVERVPDLEEVLAANDGPAENFLLVGSDSREGRRHRRPRERLDRRRGRGQWPAQRHDHGPAPGGGRRRIPAQPAPRPVGPDRRHRPLGEDQLGVQRGTAAPRPHRHRVARHPDPPLRRGRLPRLHRVGRRDRGRRDLRRERRPGREHRAPAQPRVPGAQRRAGPRLCPQPPLRGVRRRRLAARIPALPTSGGSPASSSSSAPR